MAHGLSGHVVQVELPQGMWTLPRPGVEPVSPALAGGLLITGPPGQFTGVAKRVESNASVEGWRVGLE